MTKEELIKNIPVRLINNGIQFFKVDDVIEFFSSNVCIPKGENRHQYADIIHAYAEGAEIQYKGINDLWSSPCTDFPNGLQYRIKPSEPIYEWQWYKYIDGSATFFSMDFYTDNEAEAWDKSVLKKFRDTKRERK